MESRAHWAEPMLNQLESGLDAAQVEERLALTPEQRLDRLQQFLEFLNGFDRFSGAPRPGLTSGAC